MNMDPLAEKYEGISSYSFSLNSPVLLSDSDGREITLDWERDDENNIIGVNISVTGKVIDNTARGLKEKRLKRIKNKIVADLESKIIFDGDGDFNINETTDIQIATSESDINETDHVYRIVDEVSDVPGVSNIIKEGVRAMGVAVPGQNIIYLDKNYSGTVGNHETLHSAGLLHIKAELKDGKDGRAISRRGNGGYYPYTTNDFYGNIMHQGSDKNSYGRSVQGNKITLWQINKMIRLYSEGKLNKGGQKIPEK